MSATVDLGVSCPPEESRGWNSTVSPGAIRDHGLVGVVPAEMALVLMDGVIVHDVMHASPLGRG